MKKETISIVIPVYNERESLRQLHQITESVCRKHHLTVEYLYVDDGSTDGSFSTLQEIKKNSKDSVMLIQLRIHLGKSAALAVGFVHSTGDIIVTMDADLQDDPHNIPGMITKLHEGYDMVVGWRRVRHDVWHKRVLSRIFNLVVSAVSGIRIHDFNVGLKCYRRQVTREISLYGELHRFTPVLASARGFTVGEIPVTHNERKYGTSKFGMARILHGGFDLITSFFLMTFRYQPMKLFGVLGTAFASTGIVIMLYLSVLHFIGEKIGTRPLLTFGVLLFLSGIQLFVTGLIAELITSYRHSADEYPIAKIIS